MPRPPTSPGRISPSRMNRRHFLKRAATTTAVALSAPAFLRGQDLNSKLNIAVIGCGGRGAANLAAVASENIVALCDVFEPNLERASQLHPKARKFADLRRVFDRAQDFDAVVVSTCEHTHAFATLPALELEKHVYCEKPLTYNIAEARLIREAAAKTNVTTQMGIQVHAGENYRRVVELIRTGAIGPVREVHVWVSRTWGWQASAEEATKNHDLVFTHERPSETSPIPAGLSWDLWLGPAPARPFNNVYFPGPKWYRWWDFGNGTMSDLGSHWNDLPFWALKLQAPRTIEASGPPPHAEIAPASMQATYTYPARGEMPAVTLSWYQGVNKPEVWTAGKIPNWANGVLFIGDRGMLLSDYGKHVLLPEKDFEGFQPPEPFIPKSLGQHAEWLFACKNSLPATCSFEYSGWLTEANHLGNVAYRAGQKLEWDAASMRATNCPEADRFIRRNYRDGWLLD
jgi:predicted dehydrogenase